MSLNENRKEIKGKQHGKNRVKSRKNNIKGQKE